MDKYLFPLNYKYSAKFLGIIEYSTLLPISIFIGIIIFLLYMLKVDFFVGFGIVVLFFIPPVMLLSIGVNGQPAIPYFKAVLKYSRKRKLYIYGK